MAKKVHWTAATAAGCSYWLLIWLFIIAATLFEISRGEGDTAGLRNTAIVLSVFALWSAYRGKRRIDLLQNGEITNGYVFVETHVNLSLETGNYGTVKYKSYSYKVNGEDYKNTLLFSTALIGKDKLEVVYHTRKPDRSLPLGLLRAQYDRPANQWQSSMGQAVPRLTLLIACAGGILAAFARGIPLS